MNILGIGVDVVEVQRIKDSIESFGEKFLDRVFTHNEQLYCEKKRDKELNYAARFAAKEAVSKAFGTGVGQSMGWTDIEIVHSEAGQPQVLLHGKAESHAKACRMKQVSVSLTHTDHYAAANALIVTE